MDYLNPDLIANIRDPITLCNLMSDTDLRLEIDLTDVSNSYLLTIVGKLPIWISGTFIRNCPVLVFDQHQQAIGHYFDAPAMLFGFVIRERKIAFSNKYLKSIAFQKIVHEETTHFPGFASSYNHSIVQKVWNLLTLSPLYRRDSTDIIQNANVNIWRYGDEFVALTETPKPVIFHPQSLSTIGSLTYMDSLPQSECWECAHPIIDIATGDTINFLIQYGFETCYVIYCVPAGTHTRETIARIPVDRASYMHSFSITENYIILVENPLVVNALDFLIRDCGFIQHYYWDPDRLSTFIIINRSTGEVVARLKHEVFFSFHHVNAFELNQEIVLDLIAYPDHSIIDALKAKIITGRRSSNLIPVLKRFYVSPQTNSVRVSDFTLSDIEFPRINDRYYGVAYRYLYAVDTRDSVQPEDVEKTLSLYKIDMLTNSRIAWSEPDCVCDEPVFIPAPTFQSEDDGVVLSIVSNMRTNSSFLLCLDATSFQELARAALPMFVPRGLHGRFFESEYQEK